ncbi:MAG: YgiT-type zinc finger protein [bacterium]|nr:YgiT-type zinc finger protein [bacterium]
MPRTYHNCHFCGGRVIEENILIDYRWGKDFVAIIENVPTGVCQVCGEQYLKGEVVKEMEKLVHSKNAPKKIIEVPLKELALAV